MTNFDDELRTLRAQAARKKQLHAMLDALYARRGELEAREQELSAVRAAEQKDVDRLEGRSLAALFYSVLGRKDEQLDKEQQEAYAAAVKHDSAVRELEAVRQDIARYESELGTLEGCEARYEQVLADKREALKASGARQAERILQLEQEIAAQGAQAREIEEAIDAGRTARDTAESILASLHSAGNWGTFDMFGGGLVADLAKHSHLDSAQDQIETLQIQLSRFRTELSDVTIQADIQAQVDGFLRFADYFFDGLFVDWMVLDRIQQSQAQVENTAGQIKGVLRRLYGMQDACRAARQKAQDELDALVLAS